LPEADATTSNTVQQPVGAQNVQRPAPQQLPPVQTSVPASSTTRTSGGQTQPENVAVSELNRTNYVGPEYPRAARRRNITGVVEVQFTVTTDGRVRSMSILRSEPGDTFDQAAMDAVEQWRFEPVIENGVAVEKRTAVRLAFDLQ
jgi:TonB family protein